MVHRLVVVAVKQDEIVHLEQGRRDDFVRRRCAVQDEISPVGAEDLGGIFLRRQRRPFVDQQIAELQYRIVDIVAEYRVPQMLDEHPARRDCDG